MQHSRADFFGLTDVPEVFAKVTAGTASYVHFSVIFVVASGTFPFAVSVDNDLSVKSADVTVVTLGVELSVLNVVVDKLNDFSKRGQIVSHIGDLNVGDSAAGGNSLELALETELLKCVDLLTYVNVIGVGVVALVGNVRYSSESLLVNSCETVAK